MTRALESLIVFIACYSFLFLFDILALSTLYDSSRDTTYRWTDKFANDQISELLYLDIHQPTNQSLVLSTTLNFTVHGKMLSTLPGRHIDFSISVNDADIEIESGNSYDCYKCGQMNALLDLSHFRAMTTGVYEVTVYANVVNLEDEVYSARDSRSLHIASSSIFYLVKSNNSGIVDNENELDGGTTTFENSIHEDSESLSADGNREEDVRRVVDGNEQIDYGDLKNMDELFARLASSHDPSRIKSRAQEYEAELKDFDWEEYLKIPQDEGEKILTDNTIIQSEEDSIGSVFKSHTDRLIKMFPDIGKKLRFASDADSETDDDDFIERLEFAPDTDKTITGNFFEFLSPEADSVTEANVEVFMMISSRYLESSLTRIMIQVDDEIFDITAHVREQIPMYTANMLPVAPDFRSKVPAAREVFFVELRELPDAVHTIKAWIEINVEKDIYEKDNESMLGYDQRIFTSRLA